MKKYLVIMVALLTQSLFLGSCGKDDPDPIEKSSDCSGTSVINQENIVYEDGDSEKRTYYYNTNKKVVKIEYSFNGAAAYSRFDTVIYTNTSSTEIESVKSYTVSNLTTPYKTNTYTYSGGKIVSVNEVGTNTAAFNRTRSFIYNGEVLSKMKINYSTGTRVTEEIDSITNIVFANGNVTSAKIHAAGTAGDGQTVNLTYSTVAPNPYLGLNIFVEDPMTMFNANNASAATVGGFIPVFSRTYTYTNDRVASSYEVTTGEEDINRTFTYNCL